MNELANILGSHNSQLQVNTQKQHKSEVSKSRMSIEEARSDESTDTGLRMKGLTDRDL